MKNKSRGLKPLKPVYEMQYKSSYLLEPNELDGLGLLHPTLRPFNEMGH